MAFSPVFVSASGEISPSRSILVSIGSFFKSIIFSVPPESQPTDNLSPSNPEDNPDNQSTSNQNSSENNSDNSNLVQTLDDTISLVKNLEAKYNKLQKELANLKSSGLKIEGQPANNVITERTIERIVSGQAGASGLSQVALDSKISEIRTELQNLNTNLLNQINNLSVQSSQQTSAVYQAVSLTNKIDSLSGTRLTNITVSGVTGLTDSDIPDGITASNYLPLSGGTLSGALTGTSASFSSTLTVSASTTLNGVEYKWPFADGTANQALVSNGAGGLSWATISGGSGASPDWLKQTNYGVLNLTASTTIPYWAKDAFYASSTSVFQGLATFGNASTSQISATNSYLGTVLSGTWNGTAISNQYGGTGLDSSALTGLAQIVSGTWSASSTLSTAYGGTGWNNIQANSILLGNGAGRIATTSAGTDGYVLALSNGVPTWLATSTLSTITGTLTVAKGGTGQTSFGQGWLNSDGTTLSASTSPTVAYIIATSTTATSTFAWGLQANALNITSNSATSTFANGIDLAGGCFAINGTCVGGSSSQWTTLGSNIYYNTGNVGIGTSTPGAKLHALATTEQLRLGYDSDSFTQFTIDTNGDLKIDPTGTIITIPDQNLKVCAGDACQTTTLNSSNGNLTVENNIEIGGAYNRTCATGYVWVPGSAKFGTLPGFCVMKYEAKNDGAGNVSVNPTHAPYVSIDQPTLRTKCEAIGLGYHLISEPEWMTIAENIAQTPINDMDDDAGLQLATGHSDNAPASALAATSASDPVVSGCNLSATMENAANAYSASSCEIQGDGSYGGDNTDKGFYGTSQAWSATGYSSGVASKSQLRTHILSNGNVIWDIAGNVWEWTDAYVNGTAEKPTAVTDAWQEWSAVTNYLGLSYARPQNPSWASANGIGQYYAGASAGQRGFIRGGNWSDGADDGVFTLNLDVAPSYVSTSIGFRCSR